MFIPSLLSHEVVRCVGMEDVSFRHHCKQHPGTHSLYGVESIFNFPEPLPQCIQQTAHPETLPPGRFLCTDRGAVCLFCVTEPLFSYCRTRHPGAEDSARVFPEMSRAVTLRS